MKPDTPSRERAMGEVMVLVFQIHGMGRSGVGYHEVRAGTGPVAPKEKGTPHCLNHRCPPPPSALQAKVYSPMCPAKKEEAEERSVMEIMR